MTNAAAAAFAAARAAFEDPSLAAALAAAKAAVAAARKAGGPVDAAASRSRACAVMRAEGDIRKAREALWAAAEKAHAAGALSDAEIAWVEAQQ